MVGKTTKVEFDIFARDHGSPVFDKFGRRVRSSGKDLDMFGRSAKGALTALSGLVAIDKGIDLFASSIKGASNLSETLNKADVVFGRSAEGMIKWSEDADKSLGLSEEAALGFASQFGDMFRQLGQGEQQAAKTSAGVVKLATDLSSFHNVDTAEVLDKISGAMRGEYDSIQTIIPGLSDARVKQEALRISGKASVDQLTEQEKATAALAIITKDSATAYNDFAETSGGLANKTRILDAQWENAKTTLGEGLLPVVTDIVGYLSDEGIPKFEEFGRWFSAEGIPAFKDFAGEVRPIAADVLPAVVDAGGQVVDVFKVLAPLVGDVAEGFSNLPDAGQQAIVLGASVGLLSSRMGGFNMNSREMLLNLRTMPTEMRNTAVKAAAMRAGVGAAGLGLSAFADDIGKTHEGLGELSSILGGAALGFAAGGPWGAAVGGGIGIIQAFGRANDIATADVGELTQSLSDQNGALTNNTRLLVQNALEKSGAYKDARRMGVNLGDVTDAALGDKDAAARIRALRDATAKATGLAADAQSPGSGRSQSAAVKRQFNELLEEIGAQDSAVGKAKQSWDDLNASQRQSKELNKLTAAQIRDVTKATHDIPKKVITQFTQPGYSGAVKNAADIAHKYKLTPKEVETTLKALDYTKPQIQAVIRRMKQLDRTEAHPRVDVAGNALYDLREIGRAIRDIHGKTIAFQVHGGKQLAHARGTMNAPGGLSLVGEEGPELVDMPKGSKVYTASRSRQMMSDAATRAGSRGLGSSEQAPIELELHVTFGVDQRTAAKIVQKGTPARVTLK